MYKKPIEKLTKEYFIMDVDMELHPEKGYDLFQQDSSEWTGSKKTYRD
jgi:hypothetical protein